MANVGEGASEREVAWTPEPEIFQLLSDQRRIVPFLGAGFSAAAGLPGTGDLKRVLIEHYELGLEADETSLNEVVAAISDNTAQSSRELRTVTADFFQGAVATTMSGDDSRLTIVHDLLQVPSRMVVTLNYDLLVEKIAERDLPDLEVESVGNKDLDLDTVEEWIRSPGDGLLIFHPHGKADDSETVVLDNAGYRSLTSNLRMQDVVRQLHAQRRLCFLGTRLDEIVFLNSLLRAGPYGGPHLLFASPSAAAELGTPDSRAQVSNFGIDVVPLPTDEAISGTVAYLGRPMLDEAEVRAEPVVLGNPTVVDDYVGAELASWSSEDPSVGYWTKAFENARRPRWSPDVEEDLALNAEQYVAGAHRALIVGPPGSGKSQLMSRAAQLVSTGANACLLRLRRIPVGTGEPSVLLRGWMESERRDELLGALETETFHFFLDGLDEISPDQQEKAVRNIAKVAAHYRQHSFVVSSRAIPAATIFKEEEWDCHQIQVGEDWQRRYLESKGVSLSELLEGSTNQDELRGVLEVPFFLRQAVDLHAAGESGDLTVWSLTERLIDEALNREQEENRLPISVEDARLWLQRVALSMWLSGVAKVTKEELGPVPLPGNPGDREDLIHSLIQRAMLQEVDPEEGIDTGVSFSHRIVGEFLAAEALLDVGPVPEVLAATAPRLESARSGVTPHWMMPLAFLMSKSSEWREAIKSRDWMFWAVSVPSDAPEEERREAAVEIWETYCEWDVWISRGSIFSSSARTGILGDGASLSRLLRSEGLDDVVAEVRAGLGSSSPQVQGNAIDILVGTAVEGLEDEIERILRDPNHNPVVGRRAAVAAVEREYVGLARTLIVCAESTYDEAEAETLSRAALELTPDEQLLDAAKRLATDELAGRLVLPYSSDRLGAAGSVAVLRLQIEEAPEDPYRTSEKELVDHAIKVVDDESSEEFIRDVIFLSAAVGRDSDDLGPVIEKNREIALETIADATQGDDKVGSWYYAEPLVQTFTADELEAAGFHEAIVRRKRAEEQEPERSTVKTPDIKPFDADEAANTSNPINETPTLSEVLGMDRHTGDYLIQADAQYFTRQVEDLSEEQANDLRDRLGEWRSDESFAEAVNFTERDNGARYTIKHWASAWFWFGPVLDMPLDSTDWAEFALMGVGYEEQETWLERHSSQAATDALAEVRTTGDARDWKVALASTDYDLSESVIEAIERDLLGFDRDPDYEVRLVIDRIAQTADAASVLARLRDNEVLTEMVRVKLAALGDETALRELLGELEESIREGRMIDRDSFGWIEGTSSNPAWLPTLFECLRLRVRVGNVRRIQEVPREVRVRESRVVSGGQLDETPSALIDAIQAIGGEQAAQGYEVFLRIGSREARWHRWRLDQVEEAIFAHASSLAAGAAAERLNVPLIPV